MTAHQMVLLGAPVELPAGPAPGPEAPADSDPPAVYSPEARPDLHTDTLPIADSTPGHTPAAPAHPSPGGEPTPPALPPHKPMA